MSNEWRRASAQRRGGGQTHVQFDTSFAESRYAADPSPLAPDETFDRQWALTLLDLTLNRLRAGIRGGGKTRLILTALKNCLLAGRGAIDYAAVAKQLGVNEGAARVACIGCESVFAKSIARKFHKPWPRARIWTQELRHLAAALARK